MKYLIIIVNIIIIGGIAAWAYTVVAERSANLVVNIEKEIATERSTLQELAVMTDRNAADEVVENIIDDCRSRVEFETLLGQLHLLNPEELQRVKQLFDACGDFFSLKKSFMVSRITREFDALKMLISLHQDSTESGTYRALETSWTQIVESEIQKSELLAEQVDLQGAIINDLVNGKAVDSEEISALITRANEIAQLLGVADKRVDTAREVEMGLIFE